MKLARSAFLLASPSPRVERLVRSSRLSLTGYCFVAFRLGRIVFRKNRVLVLDVRLRAKRYGATSPWPET
jgi:hypothetical protein